MKSLLNLLINDGTVSEVTSIFQDSDFEDLLDDFLQLVERASNYGDSLKKNRDIYYVCNSNGAQFCDWLYQIYEDKAEIREAKRRLSICLERIESITESEYLSYQARIEQQDTSNIPFGSTYAFISFTNSLNAHDVFRISSIAHWIKIHRYSLHKANDINDIIDSSAASFPNLSFHNNVQSSIRSLNRAFTDIINELILHLSGINDYYEEFQNQLSCNIGYRELSISFTSNTIVIGCISDGL